MLGRVGTAMCRQVRPGFVAVTYLRVVAVAWLLVLAVLYPCQRKLLYPADPERVLPMRVGLKGVTEEVIATPDGERLIAWWSAPTGNKPTVLYFHGNAGNHAWRAERVRILAEAGYGVLLPGYRGYGGSSGTPSEDAILADAGVAFDWLRARKLEPRRIVLFGESLGTGVAVQLAAKRPVAGLILDSPYSSVVDVAARRFPYLPVRHLMWDRYDSLDHIGHVRAPLLIFHGDRDGVVPFDMGVRLFAAAKEPKRMLRLPGAGHTVPLLAGPWPAIRSLLDEIELAMAYGLEATGL